MVEIDATTTSPARTTKSPRRSRNGWPHEHGRVRSADFGDDVSRQIDLPRFLRAVEGHDALDRELRTVLNELSIDAPLYVSGTSQSAAVCAGIHRVNGNRLTIEDTRVEVTRVADLLRKEYDAVVAVGAVAARSTS